MRMLTLNVPLPTMPPVSVYVMLSTRRIDADAMPITENSPQMRIPTEIAVLPLPLCQSR